MANFKFQTNTKFKDIKSKGFTIIELMVSMGILALLFGLSSVNVSQLPSNTLQSTNLDTLMSDIRFQQTLSMSNDSAYGVHFEPSSYTMFKGNTYTQGLSTNTIISLDSGIVFTNVTFQNRVLVFSSGGGDILNYSEGQDGFTFKSDPTGKVTVININKYGASY